MWLSKMMKDSDYEDRAEIGSITLSGNTLEAESSVSVRELTAYSPYGYSYIPPVGEEIMLLPSADGKAIIGSKLKMKKIKSGEIEISSKGGAKILLRNDGTVVINSLEISKEGVIKK